MIEVDKLLFDLFVGVFFLFQNEYVVIEELLQFFVCVVDVQLFEIVFFKDFKIGDVQNVDEMGFVYFYVVLIKLLVDLVYKVFEVLFVNIFRQGI